MNKTYTRKQIQEATACQKKRLKKTDAQSRMKKVGLVKHENAGMHVQHSLDESLKVSLADKQSATRALLDHNNELTAFVEQKPHPTKDELIDFVADIFKEEGLDTPWTRQFLIKMKMYTHGFDDALQYIWNARLKGDNLGMDRGLPSRRHSYNESEWYHASQYNPNEYKHLTYANASPERRYVKILKWFYDNGASDKFTCVSEVFKDNERVAGAWLSDDPRKDLRGYAVTFFGQLVNDGLLDAEKSGRFTLFSLTDKGEDLLRKCGAI